MRKFVQRQILNLISTVLEGIEYVTFPNTEPSSAIAVLEDCGAAVASIDNSLKSGLSKERYLYYKEMDNALRDMLECLSSNFVNAKPSSEISQKIKNQLDLIYKEVDCEQEIKLEIVFMPYKSSMWDSLESIWRAVKEDPQCDWYVIPIPYYVRNPDRSFGEYHYEGGDFPVDVPITPYTSYDLSERKPDIIYIHNPYDEYNYITSVDPNYYSYNLKEHTDMLVYVPYFITGGDIPKSQMRLPVFNYMDKMVVQSEEHKETYKQILPESKLLALGSPKIDRMIYYEKNRPSVPKEWVKRVTNKKIVMYNTSITGILKYGIKAIQKMEYVFSQFVGREDVVLLWRPHPLIEATLKSMNPPLFNIYLNLKEQYITKNIGIYDTTPDITASIALSDAYIGEDSSSVLHLFGVVGKPIFLTDMEITKEPTEEDQLSVRFWDGYFENDMVWFVADKYNALCKMNLQTGKIEVIDQIPETLIQDFQYCDVLKINDKIIMQPHNAASICEYDLQKEELLKKSFKDPLYYGNFDRMIQYKQYIFMKPKSYPAILRYDIHTGEYKYYTKCIEKFMKYRETNNENMFTWGVCKRDNLLLLASSKINQVLEFNMDTGGSKIHTVGSKGSNFIGMDFDGMDYWLIPNESKAIVRWNFETGNTTEYSEFPEHFIGDSEAFISIVFCGSFLLAFPRKANMIVKINKNTGKMSEFDLGLPYKEGDRHSCYNYNESNYYFAKKIDNTRVAALSVYDQSLIIIDTGIQTYSVQKCRLDTQEAGALRARIKHFGSCGESLPYASKEETYWLLKDFLSVVVDKYQNQRTQKEEYKKVIQNINGTCGKKVSQYMKEQLLHDN